MSNRHPHDWRHGGRSRMHRICSRCGLKAIEWKKNDITYYPKGYTESGTITAPLCTERKARP